MVKEKEITAEFEKILEKGPERIKLLIKRYNELIINYEEIDIFDSLEKIYLEFEDLKKNYDENKYYFKHICRNKNKNCYIIFFKESNYVIEKMTIKPVIKKYQYSDWKNDENAKKFLLEVRQNTHNYYEQQKKQKGIDDKIESKRQESIKEWDKMTSAKEHKQILICYESFKMKVNGSLGQYFDMGESTNIANTFGECNGGLEYSGSKKKLAEMISKHGKEDFNRRDAYRMMLQRIWMSKAEEKQFNAFANPTIEAFKKTLGI